MSEPAPESLRPEVPEGMEAVGTLLELARAFAPSFQLPQLVAAPPGASSGGSSSDDRARKAEARYQTLVEQIPAVTFMASFENGLSEIYVSPHIETLLGYTAREWIDNPVLWYQRLHPADKQRWNEEFSRTVSWAEPFKADYRFLAKNGRVVWIHGEAKVVRDESGQPSFVQGIGFDITELKDAEEVLNRSRAHLEELVAARTAELAAVNESLVAAKEEAERANRAKSEFLSRMSHELRTPLNAILGFGQILEAEIGAADAEESVAHILKAGRHLLGLINEVLDLASIEAGRISFTIEPVDIGDLARQSIELVRPLAAPRDIQITIARTRRRVQADAQRMKQVLLNLLSNAIKYNRERGSVTIAFEETGSNKLRISVRDTGSGLSPDDIKMLFIPFERLQAESKIEGTGLGLAVCRRLVHLMDGEIGVESTVGKGSTFWVELPLAEDLAARAEQDDGAGPVDRAPTAARCTILYIEDNLSNLKLIERILLRRPEIKFLGATHGGEGLEMAREHTPDVILLDLQLPDIPGDEVLAQLRDNPRTAAIPVIMVSANAVSDHAERMLANGAQTYLTKPLDLRGFFAAIDEALERRKDLESANS